MLCLREIATRSTGEELAQAASTYLGEQRRRSTRLEQTSPLIIRGVDLLGQPFEERTATQNLSFQGCRYASKHHLPKNTWVTLEAPSGDSRGDAVCARARVAWIQRPRTLRELFQVGVELEKPRNIWNVDFPPNDWNAERTRELSIVRLASEADELTGSKKEASLEDYLRRAATLRIEEPLSLDSGEWNDSNGTIVGQLRHEFSKESQKPIAQGHVKTEELVNEKVRDLGSEVQNSHAASTKAFYEQWIKELDESHLKAKEEIASSVERGVAAQLASFRDDVKDTVASEWAQKFSHAELALSQWQSDAQSLRNEIRADIEANMVRSDERLNSKLAEIRHELEAIFTANAEKKTEEAVREQTDSAAANVVEFDSAREQWNELVENSIESAGRRLAERITNSSREVLRNSEQTLARHAADLQKEAGITAEASRAALDEIKTALEREISTAKRALKQIEQSASTYTEFSGQLEAASHDAMEDLRSKLSSAVAQKIQEMEKRAAELEVKFAQHTDLISHQQIQDVVSRNRLEIEATVTAGTDRIKAAMEEFAARAESIENMLQIHRERLRQFAEQMQREVAARLSSDLALFEKHLDEQRNEKLEQWNEELQAQASRARDGALTALASHIELQLGKAGLRFAEEEEQSVESARKRMHAGLQIAAENFQTELEKRQAQQMGSAAEELAAAAQAQIESATAEFKNAAETAASALGEMIVETDAKALANFSAEVEEQAEEARAKLICAGEVVLQNVQAHTQTSFEHFQEQLAIKADLSVQKSSEALSRELGGKMDSFRGESEKIFGEWRTKHELFFTQIFEKSQQNIEAAANSVVDAGLEHLQERSRERVSLASEAAEQAVRQACADVFATIAQRMKEHVPVVEAANPSSQAAHMEQHE